MCGVAEFWFMNQAAIYGDNLGHEDTLDDSLMGDDPGQEDTSDDSSIADNSDLFVVDLVGDPRLKYLTNSADVADDDTDMDIDSDDEDDDSDDEDGESDDGDDESDCSAESATVDNDDDMDIDSVDKDEESDGGDSDFDEEIPRRRLDPIQRASVIRRHTRHADMRMLTLMGSMGRFDRMKAARPKTIFNLPRSTREKIYEYALQMRHEQCGDAKYAIVTGTLFDNGVHSRICWSWSTEIVQDQDHVLFHRQVVPWATPDMSLFNLATTCKKFLCEAMPYAYDRIRFKFNFELHGPQDYPKDRAFFKAAARRFRLCVEPCLVKNLIIEAELHPGTCRFLECLLRQLNGGKHMTCLDLRLRLAGQDYVTLDKEYWPLNQALVRQHEDCLTWFINEFWPTIKAAEIDFRGTDAGDDVIAFLETAEYDRMDKVRDAYCLLPLKAQLVLDICAHQHLNGDGPLGYPLCDIIRDDGYGMYTTVRRSRPPPVNHIEWALQRPPARQWRRS